MNYDMKSEYEQHIKSIDVSKEFWERHIPILIEQGCKPTSEEIEWVGAHIKGLVESRTQLQSFLKTYFGASE